MANQFKKELEVYKLISGSKINFQKSKIYGWNCSVKELGEIARTLGMEAVHDWDAFTYLGAPIFNKGSRETQWKPIIDKFKN